MKNLILVLFLVLITYMSARATSAHVHIMEQQAFSELQECLYIMQNCTVESVQTLSSEQTNQYKIKTPRGRVDLSIKFYPDVDAAERKELNNFQTNGVAGLVFRYHF